MKAKKTDDSKPKEKKERRKEERKKMPVDPQFVTDEDLKKWFNYGDNVRY